MTPGHSWSVREKRDPHLELSGCRETGCGHGGRVVARKRGFAVPTPGWWARKLMSAGTIGPSLVTGLSLGWACGLREKDPSPNTHTLSPLPTSFPADSRGSHSLAFAADPATAVSLVF